MKLARVMSYDKVGNGTSVWLAEDKDAWAISMDGSFNWFVLTCPKSFQKFLGSKQRRLALHRSNHNDQWIVYEVDDPIVPPEVLAAACAFQLNPQMFATWEDDA